MYRESGKKLLNSNIVSTCPHNMVNFSPLTAEIDSLVRGTPANFNRFLVLASLLHRRRSPEANQTLHHVWPSPGWYTTYTFSGALAPKGILPGAKFTLRPSCVLLYWQRYCTALQQRASAKLCGVVQGMELQNSRRGRYLYSAGQPSRCASAHIVVVNEIEQKCIKKNFFNALLFDFNHFFETSMLPAVILSLPENF